MSSEGENAHFTDVPSSVENGDSPRANIRHELEQAEGHTQHELDMQESERLQKEEVEKCKQLKKTHQNGVSQSTVERVSSHERAIVPNSPAHTRSRTKGSLGRSGPSGETQTKNRQTFEFIRNCENQLTDAEKHGRNKKHIFSELPSTSAVDTMEQQPTPIPETDEDAFTMPAVQQFFRKIRGMVRDFHADLATIEGTLMGTSQQSPEIQETKRQINELFDQVATSMEQLEDEVDEGIDGIELEDRLIGVRKEFEDAHFQLSKIWDACKKQAQNKETQPNFSADCENSLILSAHGEQDVFLTDRVPLNSYICPKCGKLSDLDEECCPEFNDNEQIAILERNGGSELQNQAEPHPFVDCPMGIPMEERPVDVTSLSPIPPIRGSTHAEANVLLATTNNDTVAMDLDEVVVHNQCALSRHSKTTSLAGLSDEVLEAEIQRRRVERSSFRHNSTLKSVVVRGENMPEERSTVQITQAAQRTVVQANRVAVLETSVKSHTVETSFCRLPAQSKRTQATEIARYKAMQTERDEENRQVKQKFQTHNGNAQTKVLNFMQQSSGTLGSHVAQAFGIPTNKSPTFRRTSSAPKRTIEDMQTAIAPSQLNNQMNSNQTTTQFRAPIGIAPQISGSSRSGNATDTLVGTFSRQPSFRRQSSLRRAQAPAQFQAQSSEMNSNELIGNLMTMFREALASSEEKSEKQNQLLASLVERQNDNMEKSHKLQASKFQEEQKQQLSYWVDGKAIPTFDGTNHLAVVQFSKLIKEMQRKASWSDKETLAIMATKLTGNALVQYDAARPKQYFRATRPYTGNLCVKFM